MSTDLDRCVLVPATGEALSLDAPLADLARFFEEVETVEQQLKAAKRVISDEVLARMDRNRVWTVREGARKIVGDSDAPVYKWDRKKLDMVLEQLVMEELISHDAHVAAVTTKVAYELHADGLKRLLKNPKLAERLEECRREVPEGERRRYVKVTPA